MRAVDIFAAICGDSRVDVLLERLAGPAPAAVAEGLWGSAAPILAALVSSRSQRPLLFVTAHAAAADDVLDDIETLTGRPPELFPQLENLPGEATGDDDLAAARLSLCLRLSQAKPHLPPGAPVIVAPVQALMQPVPTPAAIAGSSFALAVGREQDPERLCAWLLERGFARCEQVEVPGDFARRGGIVDVFSHAHSDPVRLEFVGHEVESIRLFDAGTQRSSVPLQEVLIPALRAVAPSKPTDTTGLLELLPPDTIIAIHEPSDVQELGRSYWQRLGERAGMIPVETLLGRAGRFAQVMLQRFTSGERGALAFNVDSLPHFEPRLAQSLETLAELARTHEVVVLCDNEPERQRFREVLEEAAQPAGEDGEPPHAQPPARNRTAPRRGEAQTDPQPPEQAEARPRRAAVPQELRAQLSRVRTAVGLLHHGFVWRGESSAPTAYIPHHELLARYQQRRTLRRVQPARPIDTFFDLNAGDAVVHVQHGIGRFRGLKTLDRSGRRDEYLAIEFADAAMIHVPVSQIHVVQKYIAGVRGRPKLSKLGGTAWRRTRERVAESVTDLAAEMLALQAQRETQAGIAYPSDTDWQREFEGSFLYEETPDQLRALAEIKTDMGRPRPMDRLLCGDVGYGKTELAIRAAFKAVEYGRQAAVLVPTTVLAEQHYQTFRERLADYPFVIDVLSRFRSPAEQKQVVAAARRGQIDILIGTHRILSRDVHFADLGLVIIDEEQRFGVEAKERLKQMRATVDVLTLTATPIPRTLHLSMLGIRDISALATPPADRRAIVTQVRTWEDRLVRDAVLRELNRDGQAYFVHNFVRDLPAVANRLRELVPEARVVSGHGQMGGDELEEVMLQFVRREADVLVSTNIIESGIDIPTANTIFIHRAERFGLADLHQLRGRVGRSRHRAYCYLLLSPRHPVKEAAARRLKAIEQYSDLGAGFQIAMRDLEIRGAGNILGAEQSGNIEAVGYEMYCQLLDQARRRLKNEPADTWRSVNLELGETASIPRAYIRSDRQRMEVYKRLAAARRTSDVDTLERDLRDAFGPLPDEVGTLLDFAHIRVLAQPWGIRSIVLAHPDVVFAVDDARDLEPLLSEGAGSPRVPDSKTVHWRLPARYLEPRTLRAVLRKQLARPGREPAQAGLAGAR
jgi:transcription-repair coupling factor (superfamily II helicase)